MILLLRFWCLALFSFVSVGYAQNFDLKGDAERILDGISDQPKDTVTMRKLFEQANAWYESDKYSDALRLIEVFVETDSLHADAHLLRGLLLYELEDYANAVVAINRSHKLGQDPTRGLYYRGLSYQELGRYDKALEDFTTYLEENPKNPLGHFYRSKALLEMDSLDKALEDLKIAAVLEDLKEPILLQHARILRVKGDHEGALQMLNGIVEFAEDYEVLEERYINYYEDSKYEATLPVLDEMLELLPDNEYDLYRKALALLLLERYEEAIPYYNKAILQNPDRNYRLQRAWCYYYLDREEEAIEDLDKLIAEDDSNGEYFYLRGMAIQYSYREEDGCGDLARALSLGYEDALDGLKEFCWE